MLFLLTSLRKRFLFSTQLPQLSPKLCRDTSTSNNSSGCFNKQVRLDEDVDGEILQIQDDLS